MKYFLIPLVILIVFQSCVPNSYLNNALNTPAFQEEKELHINGYLGLKHLELQLEYAPIKHLGVVANSYVRTNKSPDLSFNYFNEVGLGYIFNKNGFIIELYGGYGLGYVRDYKSDGGFSSYRKEVSSVSVNYERFFIQPLIGFVNKNYYGLGNSKTTVGFSFKANFINLQKYDYLIYLDIHEPGSWQHNDTIDNYSLRNKRIYTYDPVVFFRWNHENYNMLMQFGISDLHSDIISNRTEGFDMYDKHPFYSRLILNFGIAINLNFKKDD